MKKFSFLLLIVVPLFMNAQQSINRYADGSNQRLPVKFFSEPTSPVIQTPVIKRTANPTPISSSGNILTVGDPNSTCISANQDLSLITFAYRGNPGINATDVGDILVAYSKDLGVTWKNIFVVKKETYKHNRFPSGVIYNPAGNTNPSNAYAVFAGSSHDNVNPIVHWNYSYFGSTKIDSTNISNQYILNPKHQLDTVEQISLWTDMTTCSDGKVHITAYVGYYDVKPVTHDTFLRRYMLIRNGTFNTGTSSFDWTTSYIMLDDLLINTRDAHYTYTYLDRYGSAWSPDGSIGYIYTFGRDSLHKTDIQLKLYKSTDKGVNWSLYFEKNLCQDTNITNWIIPMRSSTKRRPIPMENDAVVDANGKLHIFALFAHAFSANPDSFSYLYTYYQSGKMIPQPIFHLSTNAKDSMDVEFIDTVQTLYVTTETSPIAYSWDHRLQASRTSDGNKIFAVWTDSNPTDVNNNSAPDIYTWGRNLTANTVYRKFNQSKGRNNEADNFFICVSEITLTESPDKCRIPVTSTQYGNTYTDPVSHFFVHDVGYNLVSLQEDYNKLFTVSTNYPNPFTSETKINLNLDKPSSVSISVVNMLGQTVKAVNYSHLSVGNHQLTINGNELTSGVYFLVVKSGGFEKSLKIMKE